MSHPRNNGEFKLYGKGQSIRIASDSFGKLSQVRVRINIQLALKLDATSSFKWKAYSAHDLVGPDMELAARTQIASLIVAVAAQWPEIAATLPAGAVTAAQDLYNSHGIHVATAPSAVQRRTMHSTSAQQQAVAGTIVVTYYSSNHHIHSVRMQKSQPWTTAVLVSKRPSFVDRGQYTVRRQGSTFEMTFDKRQVNMVDVVGEAGVLSLKKYWDQLY